MTTARATRPRPTARSNDLGEARGRLTAERVAAAARIAALERDIATIVESAKGGAIDDEHDAEGATIAFERAQAMALLEETRTQVEALDTALARVAAGSYGVCESCGQDIAAERLVARPSATLCITCASRRR
jgi:DnaK suppressor protein